MLANSLTRDYSALAGDCRGAVAASANPQVKLRLHLLEKKSHYLFNLLYIVFF